MFLSQTTSTQMVNLTQMVSFLTRIPECDTHCSALLDLFIIPDPNICSTVAFPPFGNCDHVVVFPSIWKGNVPFYRTAYDYSRGDWVGLREHLRDVPWDDIFKLDLLLQPNSVSASRLELMYTSLIVDIRSNFIHLHGFLLLVVLP